MRIVCLLAATLAACSNPEPDPSSSSNTDTSQHEFDRPNTIPDWAGELTEAPEELVIYALDPMHISAQDLPADTTSFHGYRVLGTAVLGRNRDRYALVDHLWKGIAADDGMRAACFNPRHGIRAVHGQRIADWVICFECFSLHVIDENGEQVNLGTKSFVEPEISAMYAAAGLELHGK